MATQTDSTNSIKNLLIVFLVILVFYLLSVLSSILLPLVLALLFAILFQPTIMFLRKKKVPKIIILPTISILTLGILFGIGMIISDTASDIVSQQDYLLTRLVAKIEMTIGWINSTFHTKFNLDLVIKELYNNTDNEAISNAVGGVAMGLGSFFGSFSMFALYYVLLLAGMSDYRRYISYVGGSQDSQTLLKEYENIQHSVFSYMYIKTLISLATGLFTFLVCYFFEIKFALFWGFTAFLLNFIPSIGSIIGTIFPILMSIVQFDSFQPILLLGVLLTSIQFTLGNIVEPIIMGNKLRLNTLTVLFGLVFWGYIWGITGMILSVPLLVIMKIVLERFPSFSIFGRIMGYPEKGAVYNEDF